MPFEKGKSGNPGGRPKVVGEVQALAREYTKQAIETIRDIMRDKNAPPRLVDMRLIQFLIVAMAGPHRQSIQAASIDHQTR